MVNFTIRMHIFFLKHKKCLTTVIWEGYKQCACVRPMLHIAPKFLEIAKICTNMLHTSAWAWADTEEATAVLMAAGADTAEAAEAVMVEVLECPDPQINAEPLCREMVSGISAA